MSTVPHVDHRLEDLLRGTDDLAGVPVTEHVAALEAAHDRLRDALSSSTDPRPAP